MPIYSAELHTSESDLRSNAYHMWPRKRMSLCNCVSVHTRDQFTFVHVIRALFTIFPLPTWASSLGLVPALPNSLILSAYNSFVPVNVPFSANSFILPCGAWRTWQRRKRFPLIRNLYASLANGWVFASRRWDGASHSREVNLHPFASDLLRSLSRRSPLHRLDSNSYSITTYSGMISLGQRKGPIASHEKYPATPQPRASARIQDDSPSPLNISPMPGILQPTSQSLPTSLQTSLSPCVQYVVITLSPHWSFLSRLNGWRLRFLISQYRRQPRRLIS